MAKFTFHLLGDEIIVIIQKINVIKNVVVCYKFRILR